MAAIIKAELFKLKHSVGFKVLLIVSIFTILLGLLSVIESDSTRSGYDAFYKTLLDYRQIMFVFTGIFSGIFIGDDFSNRMFQAEVSKGVSRLNVILCKVIVYGIGLSILFCFQISVVTLISSILNGFGEGMSVLDLLLSSLMFMFQLFSLSMVCVIIAMLLKSKGAIMAVNVLILVVMDALLQVLASNVDIFLKIYTHSPFILMISSADPNITFNELMPYISIGFMILSIGFILAYKIFDKTELS